MKFEKGHKLGRPPRVLTEKDLAAITAGTASGWKAKDITHALHVSPQWFKEYSKAHPEVAEAIAAGESEFHTSLIGREVQIAFDTNPANLREAATMLRWLSESRFDYRTRDPVNVDNGPRVTINLPGAFPKDEWPGPRHRSALI